MQTQHEIEGGWTDLKGKIKETWGQISGDELSRFEGNLEQLVGMIQQKTGHTRAEIENRLHELDEQFRPMLAQAAATAREYAQQAAQAASSATGYVRDRVSAGHAEAEDMVRHRPLGSVAVAFGTGIAAGFLVGLLFRQR